MGGLFGGGGGGTVTYVPQTTTEQAAQDSKKGATDIEKLKDKNTRRKTYGQANQSFTSDNNLLAGSDTTLSSGSLLSLGGTLG